MKKIVLFLIVAVLLVLILRELSTPAHAPFLDSETPSPEAALSPLLDHRFPGENTTQRAPAKYPEATDVVTRLGLSVHTLDDMSYLGTNEWLDRYLIDVKVDVKDKTAEVQQRLTLTNRTGYTQQEIYFHIYPNAFREVSTAPALLGLQKSYPNGFSPGELELESITIDGESAPPHFQVMGETASVLKVVPAEPWAEGQHITLFFSYHLTLPETLERFGHFGGFFNFAHFYPILAVFDDSGWNLDPYTSTGDPFYSDIADYSVNVTIDQAYEVASSGKLLQVLTAEDQKTYRFKATNVRAFCFAAYDKWHKSTTKVGQTELIIYVTDPEKAKPYIEAASGMLKALHDYLGPYPYPTLSFVESEYISAMEFPGLIIIPTHAMGDGADQAWALEACAHEVAHQYFYGLVGNDQFDEAWLDEGFATYLNYVWHPTYGAFNVEQNEQAMQQVIKAASLYDQYEGVLVKPLDQFSGDDPYWSIYDAGALFLNKLRVHLGDHVFDQGMRTYFETYKYKLADSDEFFAVMEEVSGKDLRTFVRLHLKYELKP